MPWVKVDDHFPDNRKVSLLSDRAFRLYISALCWSSANLTEGRILGKELSVVARIRGIKAAAAELEAAGLWDPTESGWTIHDYLIYNPDRAQVQAERTANAARQKAFRDRKRAEREAEKAAEEKKRNAVTHRSSARENDSSTTRTRHDGDTTAQESDLANQSSSQVEGFRNGVSNGTPSRPVLPSKEGSTENSMQREPAPYDTLRDLKRAASAAGLQAVAWDLTLPQIEQARQAVEEVGVTAMVDHAIASVRAFGSLPRGASAWLKGWASLEAAPHGSGLPATAGPNVVALSDHRGQMLAGGDARYAEHLNVIAQLRAMEDQ